MAALRSSNKEYHYFKILQHWEPTTTLLPPRELANPASKLFPLFAYLYEKAQNEYQSFPLRKNGEKPFLHPLNVVQQLQKAGVKDELTWCIGLMHDFVEEKVDYYKYEKKLKPSQKSAKILDAYEQKLFQELDDNLRLFCQKTEINCKLILPMITTLKLLTHHKKDFYYNYISGIFNYPDLETRERAIQVKLADRMHNILCIQCFNEEERLYQCYKNMFILNNTKNFLLDRYGPGILKNEIFSPTEKLFNKCGKATYDAYMIICHISLQQNISSVVSMLQLAFKKFDLLEKGLWAVTKVNEKETHPMRLYQGIVRKYDCRLLHEWSSYHQMRESEMKYCCRFFSDFNFKEEQLRAILDYKDAYALRELVAYLLYQPDFVVHGLLSSRLFHKSK